MKNIQEIRIASSKSRKVLLLGFFAVSALYLSMRALVDPEPHHDGIIFANAVASKDGLFPNRDFFSQYGPLFATFGGWSLKLFGSHLYVLRIVNAIILAVIALFIVYWVSKFFGMRFAILISLIWVFSSGQIWVALLPWSSVLLQLIIISAVSLLIAFSGRDGNKSYLAFFFSGFILTLGIFVRIQSSFFIILLGIIVLSEKKKLRRKSFLYVLGSLISFLILISWLIINHSLADYYNECIVWAQDKYGSPHFPFLSLIPLVYFPGITLAWILWYRFLTKKSTTNAIQKFSILKLLPFLFLCLCLVVTLLNDQSYLSIRHPDILLRDIFANFLFSPHYLVVTFAAIIAICYAFQLVKNINKRFSSSIHEKIGIFLLCTGLIQLYPAWDKGHIWYVTPQLILGVALYFSAKDGMFQPLTTHLFPTVISFFLILLLQNIYVMSQTRIQFHDEIFKFMRSSPETVSNFDTNFAALRTIPSKSSVILDCTDAIFSVSQGSYSIRNLNMVNWSPDGLRKLPAADYIFACNMTLEDIAKYLTRDFILLGTYPSINLLDKNNFILKREIGSRVE